MLQKSKRHNIRIVYMKTISKSYKKKDREYERDRKQQCVYNTHDTKTSNTFQINHQQQTDKDKHMYKRSQ